MSLCIECNLLPVTKLRLSREEKKSGTASAIENRLSQLKKLKKGKRRNVCGNEVKDTRTNNTLILTPRKVVRLYVRKGNLNPVTEKQTNTKCLSTELPSSLLMSNGVFPGSASTANSDIISY